MILSASQISKQFGSLSILKGIDLSVEEGQAVAIMGKSGEGKSTLLHILGTLEAPTSGTLAIEGKVPTPSSVSKIRNEKIGFIFQSYYLLEDFTVLDNILMPIKISKKFTKEKILRAHELLEAVNLKHKEKTLCKHLSGGEKQRVAIARALVFSPPLILADEPTGNLDKAHSEEIQSLLLSLAKKQNAAVIIVTHDEEFAKQCDRLLLLKEGHLYNPMA
jgi:ABC-type lipoprotein export system ATPase subunit